MVSKEAKIREKNGRAEIERRPTPTPMREVAVVLGTFHHHRLGEFQLRSTHQAERESTGRSWIKSWRSNCRDDERHRARTAPLS
jgi:hypothetical protein